MNIKTKKQNSDGLVRLETSGSVKEILVKSDFLKPKDAKIAVCFKGKNSSGIVEFTKKEIEDIYKEVESKTRFVENTKVMKFGKED